MPTEGFHLSSVAHLESPDGRTATNLDGLRDGIESVGSDVLFHHIARISIRHPGARDLPANDFARWVGSALQEQEVSERLAFAGAQSLSPLEEVREAMLRVLERVPARRRRQEAPEEAAFHFVRVRSIPAALALDVADPKDIVDLWRDVDLGAVFYHLIETPLLGPEDARLIPWLRARGAERLAQAAEELTASGRPLARLHRDLGTRWRRMLIPDRLVRRLEATEDARRADASAAIARLAERLRSTPKEKPEP